MIVGRRFMAMLFTKPVQRKKRAHPPCSEVGLGQQARLVGQPEHLGIMRDLAARLEPGGHDEMALPAVEPGKEGNAGLVEPGRRLEDFAAERNGRGKQRPVSFDVAQRQRLQRLRCGGGNRGEDAEQRMGMAVAIALDQRRIVEIIAGIEPHAFRQAGAEAYLVRLVQQRNLDAIHLGRVFGDQCQHEFRGLADIVRSPIAGERRIEHVAQPVQDHRLLRLVDEPAIDGAIGAFDPHPCAGNAREAIRINCPPAASIASICVS